ncbi:MAG TPA: SpoIID/LytB domain-containing protein, partial [Actinomycetota bacterium]|nr:SpoIID/LytB domain-containing protein [Actinomycetota bacterium]
MVDSRAAAVPLPENGTVVFAGHGWGHGRGMGQWGAKGMADAGATWQQIVTHYYSGVTIASRAPETIRVLLETSADTVVTSDAPFNIAWTTGTAIATSDSTYKFWRVTLSGSSYLVQKSPSSTGPWTAVRSRAQAVVFTPGSQMLQLVYGSGVVRYYRGTITSRYASGSGMRAINELPLEQYLYGSVPRESPSSWPAEELKAQAVAARTYAVYKKLNARAAGDSYDICTTSACQSYLGYASKPSVTGTKTVLEAASTNAAIDATAGQVLLYSGQPICAEYSSSTGGYTAPGTVPYEKAVPDPTDSVSPLHDWTGNVSVSAIEAAWPSIGRLVDVTVTQRNGYGDMGGRVLGLNLVGTSSTVTVTGWDMQGAFPSAIRSDWFTPLYWRG